VSEKVGVKDQATTSIQDARSIHALLKTSTWH